MNNNTSKIYLAVSGLSWGIQDLPLQLEVFLGVAHGLNCSAACGILVPPPGIEPTHLTLKAWSPNHWPVREFLWGPMIILNLTGESMVSQLISDGARIWGFSRDLDFYFISTVVSEYSL